MVIVAALAALTLLDKQNVAARDLAAGALRAPCERQLINAVRAASPPAERSRLITTRIKGKLYVWYGDPAYPSGRIPFGFTAIVITRPGIRPKRELFITSLVRFAI